MPIARILPKSIMKKRSLFRPKAESVALSPPTPKVKQGIQVLQDFGFHLNAFQSYTPEPALTSSRSYFRRESLHVSDLWSLRLRKSFLIAAGLKEAQNARKRQVRLQPFILQPIVRDCPAFSSSLSGVRLSKVSGRCSVEAQSERKRERDHKMEDILMKLEDTAESAVATRKSLYWLYSHKAKGLRKGHSTKSLIS